MNKLLINAAVLTASISLITGCSTNTQSQNTGIGAVGGAVVGGGVNPHINGELRWLNKCA